MRLARTSAVCEKSQKGQKIDPSFAQRTFKYLDVSPSSNAKEREIKVEIRKQYLPNYERYSDKLARDFPGSERPLRQI